MKKGCYKPLFETMKVHSAAGPKHIYKIINAKLPAHITKLN